MPRPDWSFDWGQLANGWNAAPAVVADPRCRLRVVLLVFIAAAFLVIARAVQLELTQGADFRREAAEPLLRERDLPGRRGRILAADGTVLAEDQQVSGLAVEYRWLEKPPNAKWLRATARRRMPRRDRRNPDLIAKEESKLRVERADLHRRLAELCGLSAEEWDRRRQRIQTRVASMAERVNERRQESYKRERELREQEKADESASWLTRLSRGMIDALKEPDELPPPRVVVAEELDHHVIVEQLSPAALQKLRTNAEQFAGVRIDERARRHYPQSTLAAHLVGHLGKLQAEELAEDNRAVEYRVGDQVGRMGVEAQYEAAIRARRGIAIDQVDHWGHALSTMQKRAAADGRDLVLTVDSQVQRAAEELLDTAIARRAPRPGSQVEQAGGAVIVLDVETGAVLAAASAPRFDPNVFAGADSDQLSELLQDANHPLFDRSIKMALPPGSVFKTLSALAFLESGQIAANRPLHCQGYLRHPDEQRCAIFRQFGVGHGDVTLRDALVQSCNVYFFQHAATLGAEPILAWGERFGFGRRAGIDLPGEASGNLPSANGDSAGIPRVWRTGDTQALSIGQSSLTATPLQIARMMAAIANDGRLVAPHVARGWQNDDGSIEPVDFPQPQLVQGVSYSTLNTIRDALERVVTDLKGTAHASVYLKSLAIAGKTGTAESGGGQEDHSWFAGYAPADNPQVAFVVVLQHAGSGSTMAAPIARRLLMQMQEQGYFGAGSPRTALSQIEPK